MKILNIIFSLFFCLLVVETHAQDITLVANTWPPYVDKALPDDGLAIKIVKSAFKRAGFSTKVRIETWEKVLEGSKLGVYDVAGAIWKSDSRQKKLLYSDSYLTNNIVLISHVNNQLKFNSLEDLHGLLVGILKDYAYDETFMNDKKILKVQANRLTQNLIAVNKEQIDVAVGDRRLALYELKHFMSHSRNEFQFLPKALASRKLYIASPRVNPQSKEIIAQFNKGLAAIKKEGLYQKILDEYTY
jgi:polar amino acid transport system substrate-binding protein